MIIDYEHEAKTNLNRILDDNSISDINKENLQKYLNAIEVSPARQGIICRHIVMLFKKNKDLVGTMKDRDSINTMFKEIKRDTKPGYFQTIKAVGKAFIRWHNDGETPEGWKDIKSLKKDSQRRDLSPKDMVTWQDGLNMIDKTNSIQLKAILMIQLDGGFRPSEFIDLNYGDITKEGKYYVAKVSGKTGKRNVVLFKCIPYLEKWLRQHPYKEDKSPLWIIETPGNSRDNEIRYKYFAIVKRIRKLGELANIKKPLDFYNLRHSSAVIKKLDNVPVDVAALNMGHSVKHFTETYGRLSLKDITNRYDKAYGMTKKEAEQENPIECQYCHTVNEPKTEYCSQCNNPLNMNVALKEVQKSKDMEERLKQMEEMQRKMAEFLAKQTNSEELKKALSF